MNLETISPNARVALKKAAQEAVLLNALSTASKDCTDAVHTALGETWHPVISRMMGHLDNVPGELHDGENSLFAQLVGHALDETQLRCIAAAKRDKLKRAAKAINIARAKKRAAMI
ncbi:hypothetical protein PXK56_18200 [Phaeobacter gallaeciensis]|uniref:hypothetical protein n=1 Tax=Phaeobacter gallaeciensis TaxID=60890 RepID=UPI0023800150|nr:hypothetical protein [Phaeobacter gallaeciensis]MDE4297119.1 hypothetical protein [Phaeobacter gallaeciensis]